MRAEDEAAMFRELRRAARREQRDRQDAGMLAATLAALVFAASIAWWF